MLVSSLILQNYIKIKAQFIFLFEVKEKRINLNKSNLNFYVICKINNTNTISNVLRSNKDIKNANTDYIWASSAHEKCSSAHRSNTLLLVNQIHPSEAFSPKGWVEWTFIET